MKTQGFTLIEVLVVVLIIGILTSIALPQYQKAVEKSRAVSLFPLLNSLAREQSFLLLANGAYTNQAKDLVNISLDLASETPHHHWGCFYYQLKDGTVFGLCHASGSVSVSNKNISLGKSQTSEGHPGTTTCWGRNGGQKVCQSWGTGLQNASCVFDNPATTAGCAGGTTFF